MVKVTSVDTASRAHRHGILPGDILISINGNPISDVLDYRFYLTERTVDLTLSRDGEEYTVRIKKGEYDDVGLGFETPLMDKKHTCKNGCIFCFIDQNPKGLRDSLYFKDDDSRLSFIHGNYVTLTNMTDADVARIVKMRISPINVSIHTTNPDLRVKMMKNKRAGEVLKYLDDFKNAGLSVCGQIVLCRGVNDGDELLRTMRDLAAYYPSLTSVSVVPAGLTKFRDGLYPLTDFTPEEASAVIDAVDAVAEAHRAEHGSRLFFAADELYLKAGRPLPDTDYYEDYPQIENGVGMLRSLSDELGMAASDLADMIKEHRSPTSSPRHVTLVTGVAAYPYLVSFADKITALCPDISAEVCKITNSFFGESITVAGLLTGRDIAEQLEGRPLGDELLIPINALRHGDDVFLCGMTVDELAARLGTPVRAVENDGYDLVAAILGVSAEDIL